MKQVEFTDALTAKLVNHQISDQLEDGMVRIKTLISLVSTGSELGAFQNLEGNLKFPIFPGYTVIGRIDLSDKPEDIGKLVLADYNHAEYGVVKRSSCIFLKQSEHLEEIIFARMAAVSMSSIVDTTVKPFEEVLVLGLGMVGSLACQVLHQLGYTVVAIDRDEGRCEHIHDLTGISTYPDVKSLQESHAAKFGLLLECTGVDQVLLEGLSLMKKRAEVYQIGVPWKEYSSHTMHELLRSIFYGFITLKSGWEWFLPSQADEYRWYGHADNIQRAADWIANGRINVKDQFKIYRPEDCQAAYAGLANRTEHHSVIFDWR
ncbi:zinc-binding dehydrogenase [Lacticaseibacillus hegangensis]|uniref:Zinc-binding dehydrogenase n=1 Tax=Lacticaseibacillus hegangensis TaxID=2486010 RepID=A0ABW4CTG9_9LACO|nr:zinc-binding dehydrogenase [Lacticaseibacillus hegangensis]